MNHWEKILVPPDVSLQEALAVLDQQALKIVLVVDAERHLLGTLTDGDVRRALLANMPLTSRVADAMHRNPTTAEEGATSAELHAMMEPRALLQVPIIDKDGRVTGLATLHGLLERPQLDNPIFIMAGGFGTRLKPLTDNCPKPMLQVGGKPMLELILKSFARLGFHRFYISTHYMPEVIQDYFGTGTRWGVSIQYVHEETPLGTGGALSLLPRDEIDAPLFMINGDVLTNLDFLALLAFHVKQGGVATMCTREFEQQVPYGVVQSEAQRLRIIVEKPVQQFQINAGVYLLEPELLDRIPKGVKLDMPTLLQEEAARNNQVNIYPIREYWLDIGRMDDFQRAQADIVELQRG